MTVAVSGRPARRAPIRAKKSFIAASMRRIRVDGVEARYLVAGSGPPLLLVASPLVLARTYRPLVRALASSFTVVVVELPGAGGSDRLDRAWSSERYGRWLVDFVRRLPLAAPIVIGHSDSAPMVMEAARLAPRELRGIVLALGQPIFGLRATPHVVRNLLRHGRVFFEHVRAAATVDATRSAADIHLPTLLACGDRDRSVPLERASRLGRTIDGAKLVVGSGSHDWIVKRAEAFSAAVRRFTADIASPRWS